MSHQTSTKSAPGNWGHWSAAHDWPARAGDHDDDLSRLRREQRAAELEQALDEIVEIARAGLGRIAERLRGMESDELPLNVLHLWLKVFAEVLLRIHGSDDKRVVEVQGEVDFLVYVSNRAEAEGIDPDAAVPDYSGPARVSGSAGTGKTIVALHRAVFLARQDEDARVLLTTFSDALANGLRTQLRRLVSNQPQLAERVEVYSMDAIGRRLYQLNAGPAQIASQEVIQEILSEAAAGVDGHRFTAQFLLAEWEQIIDAWQLTTWEAYRDVARIGRRTRLPEEQRRVLWAIFERVRAELARGDLTTQAGLFTKLASLYDSRAASPFEYLIVDEAQDIGVAQLRFLAALAGERANSLFFAGDLAQRIFQQPFSWSSLGVDVRGRSQTLRINYRTSHQIRTQADRLLGPEGSDVDGNVETRRGTISLFNGAEPVISVNESIEAEVATVSQWLRARISEGILSHEIAIFVRSEEELDRAQAAVNQAGPSSRVLDERLASAAGLVSISTMHLAKGLEFRAVVVMACDDEVIPLQDRIQAAADESELREVYDTERHLLYVACTRARDFLLVSSADDPSEFLADLAGTQHHALRTF